MYKVVRTDADAVLVPEYWPIFPQREEYKKKPPNLKYGYTFLCTIQLTMVKLWILSIHQSTDKWLKKLRKL